MSREPSIKELVNQLLASKRPDRYTVGGGDDETEWLNQIAREIEPLIPEAQAVRQLALKIVAQQEGSATRQTNKLFRDLARSGQLPLTLEDKKDFPLSVVSAHPDDPTKKIEERVALRAATVLDLRAFAHEERRRAASDFSARNDACLGAEMCADGAQKRGDRQVWSYMETLTTETPGDPDPSLWPDDDE